MIATDSKDWVLWTVVKNSNDHPVFNPTNEADAPTLLKKQPQHYYSRKAGELSIFTLNENELALKALKHELDVIQKFLESVKHLFTFSSISVLLQIRDQINTLDKQSLENHEDEKLLKSVRKKESTSLETLSYYLANIAEWESAAESLKTKIKKHEQEIKENDGKIKKCYKFYANEMSEATVQIATHYGLTWLAPSEKKVEKLLTETYINMLFYDMITMEQIPLLLQFIANSMDKLAEAAKNTTSQIYRWWHYYPNAEDQFYLLLTLVMLHHKFLNGSPFNTRTWLRLAEHSCRKLDMESDLSLKQLYSREIDFFVTLVNSTQKPMLLSKTDIENETSPRANPGIVPQ